MKKPLFSLVAKGLALTVWVLAFHLSSPSQVIAGTDRGMVWELESDSATVFLAGSIHVLSADDHPLPPAYEAAYQASDKIVFEIDPREMFSAEGMRAFERYAKLPEGKTLSEVLSPEAFDELQKYIEKRDFYMEGFSGQQPWSVGITLTSLELMQMGITPMSGVDMFFSRKARRDDKALGGLETMEFQARLFGELPMPEQEMFLRSTLSEIEVLQEDMGKMIRYWRKGKDDELAEFINVGLEEFPSLQQTFVDDRNRDWIPAIESFLEGDQNVMVIVGAGHLVGNNSVIELLEENGHSPVRREK